MSSERNGSGEIGRVLEKAVRDIARQNAELREVLRDSDLKPEVFAKVIAFQPAAPTNPAKRHWIGARG